MCLRVLTFVLLFSLGCSLASETLQTLFVAFSSTKQSTAATHDDDEDEEMSDVSGRVHQMRSIAVMEEEEEEEEEKWRWSSESVPSRVMRVLSRYSKLEKSGVQYGMLH